MLRVCMYCSFHSTIPRVQSFIINIVSSALDLPTRTIKFCSVDFGVTSRLPGFTDA